MGRRKITSSKDEEKSMFLEICEKIANSKEGITHILKEDPRYPSMDTFFRWKRASPELNKIYLDAKDTQGHAFADGIGDVGKELEALGKVDDSKYVTAHSGRLTALKNIREWQAKNFAPRQYGGPDAAELEKIKDAYEKILSGAMNGNNS